MAEINPIVAQKYGLDGDWDELYITINNPSSQNIVTDIFNPTQSFQQNVPVIPTTSLTSPPSIYTTVSTAPFQSIGVVYDTNNNKLWSGRRNLGGGTVFTLSDNPVQTSPATFNTIATVQDGITALSFSPTSNKVIVGSLNSNFLTIIDATTEAVIANVNMGTVGVNWIEYNSINNSWWVSSLSDFIYEIDAATNALINTISLGALAVPFGIGFNSNNNRIYVTDVGLGNNHLFKIDCSTGVLEATINTVGFVQEPSSCVVDATRNKAYVGSYQTFGIWTFDVLTDTFVSNITNTYRASDFLIHAPSDTVYAVGQSIGVGNLLNIDSNTDVINSTLNFTQIFDRITLAFNQSKNIVYFSSVTIAPFHINSLMPTSGLYITGSADYNDTVRDFFNSPAWVRRIYIYSQNQQDFGRVINHVYKDANGNILKLPIFASLSVGVNQFQSGYGQVDFPRKNCVLGINQWFENVLIEANSSISFLLIYKQIEKVKLLTGTFESGSKTICDEYLDCPNTVRKWSDIDLALNDWSKYSVYKQNMYEGLKQDVVRPFSMDMLYPEHADINTDNV